jgi:hypothetical protein
MKRDELIQALVTRKLMSGDKNKVGCVPCLGMVGKGALKPSVGSNAAPKS